MSKCVFCSIIDGSLAAKLLFEDDDCIVIKDVAPAAPIHLLAITKQHYEDITKIEDAELIGRLISSLCKTAKESEMTEGGFRLVINTGEIGGQSVPHLHVHLLSGRDLQWPPG